MAIERLQKILARAGYGSRRACEELIQARRVTVDGRVAELGQSADPATQRILVDGQPVRLPTTHTYVALNKPRGVVSTMSDPEGRRTVRELVALPERIYPVGRLDTDSEGLILLTDDGELTQQLTHPRYRHPRIYRVLVEGIPTAETLERWRRGVQLDTRPARFDQVIAERTDEGRTWLRVTVHEGRNHLVRRVAAALGHPVVRLIRVAMGPVRLGDLPPGQWRRLTSEEVAALKDETMRQRTTPLSRPARERTTTSNRRPAAGDRRPGARAPQSRQRSTSTDDRPRSESRRPAPSPRKERKAG